MYNRFNLEGLPTEHSRKSNSRHAESPADTEVGVITKARQSPPLTTLEETVAEDWKRVLIEDDVVIVVSTPLNTDNTSTSPQGFGHNGARSSEILLPASEDVASEALAASGSPDRTSFTAYDVVEDAVFSLSTDFGTSASALEPEIVAPEEGETGRSHKRKKGNKMSAAEVHDRTMQNLSAIGLIDVQHGGGRTRHPYRLKEPSRLKTPLGKMCSTIFDKKGNPSDARSNQNSPFADNDSGYHSGRGTPSTLHLRDSLISRPESLTEFRGLYRVACHVLHEPKHPEQYREVQACHFCGYSGIHSLAWSSNHLSLQEFEVELRSNDLYDFHALDATGNSALHYAAISGSSYDHLKALIHAGVPLNARNRANQNFLHCLRRRNAYTKYCSPDCFELGLVDLLNLVEPKATLGQQDNDGQTVLHVLASHITEPETRDQTFK